MAEFSARFRLALHHTLILFAAGLTAIFLWVYLRLPQGYLLLVVFAFLSAVRIADFSSRQMRLQILLGMLFSTAILQYIVSATNNIPLINIFMPAAASWVILKKLPSASAYPALLPGFLAYSAAPGAYAAAERVFDLLLAGAASWLITLPIPGKIRLPDDNSAEHTVSPARAFIDSFTLLSALFLYKILSMPQGIWIVLTPIFIFLARRPGEFGGELVRQRIFSVPAGILLGGVYSGTVVVFDYRLAYLAPLICAMGFFMLYYRHDFFLFSLFFMIAFTVCADWMTGTLHGFNFLQFLFARTLATIIGAALFAGVEQSAANAFSGVAAA